VLGPVTDWGDTFDTKTGVDWKVYPGELNLGRIALEPAVEHTVDGSFDGAISVYATDIDDDGDIDVVGAGHYADDVTWWENVDGSGTSWTEHTVDGSFYDAHSVYAADVDDDGDMDVLGAAYHASSADDITWWSNDDGSGTSWTEHTIASGFYRATSVYASDVDDDGDMDVLGTSAFLHDITWWSNDDGSGTSWTEHTIDGNFDGAISVYAADVDEDGCMDVLGTAAYADDITWWSNDDGAGTSWTEHTIDGDFDYARSVCAADLDDDGNTDVLGAAFYADEIAWWEVTEPSSSGELVSSIYDTEGSPDWGFIDWTADTPENTTVKFQMRSSEAWGAMGDWTIDITEHPFNLSGFIPDGDRYVQYKTILETTDTDVSPTLYDITIDWGYTDIAVTAFSAASAADGVEVSWEYTDAVSGFNLYRSTGPDSGKAITSRDTLNAELITGGSPYSYLDAAVEKDVTYSYWLEATKLSVTAETFGPVECTWNGALPTTYALYQSRPNPATGTATIAFDLPEDTKVSLTVYDISGRKVTTVVNETLTVGTHKRTVAGLSPGVYVYRLNAGSFSAARKMVVVE